jgi:hypothetical protein
MTARVLCTHCQAPYQVSTSNIGKQARCKKCGRPFVIGADLTNTSEATAPGVEPEVRLSTGKPETAPPLPSVAASPWQDLCDTTAPLRARPPSARPRRWWLGILGLIILGAATAFVFWTAGFLNLRISPLAPERVTETNFRRLNTDMSLSEVEAILGPGTDVRGEGIPPELDEQIERSQLPEYASLPKVERWRKWTGERASIYVGLNNGSKEARVVIAGWLTAGHLDLIYRTDSSSPAEDSGAATKPVQGFPGWPPPSPKPVTHQVNYQGAKLKKILLDFKKGTGLSFLLDVQGKEVHVFPGLEARLIDQKGKDVPRGQWGPHLQERSTVLDVSTKKANVPEFGGDVELILEMRVIRMDPPGPEPVPDLDAKLAGRRLTPWDPKKYKPEKSAIKLSTHYRSDWDPKRYKVGDYVEYVDQEGEFLFSEGVLEVGDHYYIGVRKTTPGSLVIELFFRNEFSLPDSPFYPKPTKKKVGTKDIKVGDREVQAELIEEYSGKKLFSRKWVSDEIPLDGLVENLRASDNRILQKLAAFQRGK